MKVKTRSVRNRMLGETRKALKGAAGSNQVLSKTEAKKLPKEVARAAEAVRTQKGRVTVNEAVDAYASKLTRLLASVDKGTKGVLTETEARSIRDPAWRTAVLDARTKLLSGESSGGTGAAGRSSAPLLAALKPKLDPLEAFHESGDHGVNVTLRKVPGRTLTEVLANLTGDPDAPWTHAEASVKLTPAAGVSSTIGAFTSFASTSLENERDDMPDVIESFTDAVKAQFGALSDVRLAKGGDLGGAYLIGKTSDGYVAVVAQPYGD